MKEVFNTLGSCFCLVLVYVSLVFLQVGRIYTHELLGLELRSTLSPRWHTVLDFRSAEADDLSVLTQPGVGLFCAIGGQTDSAGWLLIFQCNGLGSPRGSHTVKCRGQCVVGHDTQLLCKD
ncbi:hypothetical protein BaRGS_00036627 [Batillaria attramentaria]|uniref:Uncharacterized protein n=1 Tax=Batillaria attramentaria TaxID=370345 RepID=A0ABD0JBA1_9CAEN